MYLIIFNVINIVTAGILMFILNILPQKYGKKNQYLIILFGLLVLHFILIHFQIIGILSIPNFAPLVLTIIIGYGPVFYFYIKNFYGLKNKNVFWQIVLPLFGLHTIYGLMYFGLDVIPQWFLSTYYMSILLVYFIKSVFIINKYINKEEYKWMKTCTIGFCGLIIFFTVEAIWINVDLESVIAAEDYTTYAFNIFCLGFSLIAIYQIIKTPGIFANIRLSKSYKNSTTNVSELELKLIIEYVIDQKQFQNPELTRNLISENTGLSVHRISEIINKKIKKNFNEWINELRIDLAKEILTNTDQSIKETYFEAGFKSKSAFNTAFKKQVGLTPSAFKISEKSLSKEPYNYVLKI